MDLKVIPRKIVEPEEERAVSPVIGVILMVAITVILAAVIAAFVLNMGPSSADPVAAVGITDDASDEVEVELQSLDSNTDGIAIVDDNTNEVIGTLTVTGETTTVTTSGEYSVHAYSGDQPSVNDNIADVVDQHAIVEEFEVVGGILTVNLANAGSSEAGTLEIEDSSGSIVRTASVDETDSSVEFTLEESNDYTVRLDDDSAGEDTSSVTGFTDGDSVTVDWTNT